MVKGLPATQHSTDLAPSAQHQGNPPAHSPTPVTRPLTVGNHEEEQGEATRRVGNDHGRHAVGEQAVEAGHAVGHAPHHRAAASTDNSGMSAQVMGPPLRSHRQHTIQAPWHHYMRQTPKAHTHSQEKKLPALGHRPVICCVGGSGRVWVFGCDVCGVGGWVELQPSVDEPRRHSAGAQSRRTQAPTPLSPSTPAASRRCTPRCWRAAASARS